MSFSKIFFIFFTLLLASCTTPADYYEEMAQTLNGATPSMKMIDNMAERGDTAGLDECLSNIKATRYEIVRIGAYEGDTTIYAPVVALLDFYDQIEIPASDAERKAFRISSQKAMMRVLMAHDEFAKKYELMRGMIEE